MLYDLQQLLFPLKKFMIKTKKVIWNTFKIFQEPIKNRQSFYTRTPKECTIEKRWSQIWLRKRKTSVKDSWSQRLNLNNKSRANRENDAPRFLSLWFLIRFAVEISPYGDFSPAAVFFSRRANFYEYFCSREKFLFDDNAANVPAAGGYFVQSY